MKPRWMDRHVQELSVVVGWVSLGMGLLLTLAPRTGVALLGWGDRVSLARVVGAADLLIGPGLLFDRRRRPRWMQARALLSAGIAVIYAWILSKPSQRSRRAAVMLGLMAAVTTTDYSLSRRLGNPTDEP